MKIYGNTQELQTYICGIKRILNVVAHLSANLCKQIDIFQDRNRNVTDRISTSNNTNLTKILGLDNQKMFLYKNES